MTLVMEENAFARSVVSQAGSVIGSYYAHELRFLSDMVLLSLWTSGPGMLVEIGSYKGRSTAAIALTAMRYSSAAVFSIDPHLGIMTGANNPDGNDEKRPVCEPSLTGFRQTINRLGLTNVRTFVGKSVDFRTPGVLTRISFLHVDGDHTTAGVRADVERFWPDLRDGAIVCFHDYGPGFPGVTEMVNKLVREGSLTRIGVVGSLFAGRFGWP